MVAQRGKRALEGPRIGSQTYTSIKLSGAAAKLELRRCFSWSGLKSGRRAHRGALGGKRRLLCSGLARTLKEKKKRSSQKRKGW